MLLLSLLIVLTPVVFTSIVVLKSAVIFALSPCGLLGLTSDNETVIWLSFGSSKAVVMSLSSVS